MGVNRLTGTPWHVEKFTRNEGDDRRHRSRCAYYQRSDGSCIRYCERCRGSAHCYYYKERVPGSEEPAAPLKQKKEERMSDQEGRMRFPVGSRVVHKSYGPGTVKKIADGRITVSFDKGREVMLGLDICVRGRLLRRERE